MRRSTSGSPISPPDVPLALRQQVDLTPFNSFGCRATAGELVHIQTDEPAALASACRWLDQFDGGLVLGGGSNLLFAGPDIAAVLHIRIAGREIAADGACGERPIIRAAAGEPWHPFVMWTLAQGCFGLENLALIPGTVGAAPVQNIGAYGVELAELIDSVEAFDRQTGKPVILAPQDCGFAYRDSAFKHEPDRWLITAVRFRLRRSAELMLDYGDIRSELREARIDAPTPDDVAQAVMAIRRRKLPDPARLGNAGSFFKNPLIGHQQAQQLIDRWPGMPVFDTPAGLKKLAAGWLIEQCGLKGYRDGDAGVHAEHALVLVNHGNAGGQQILALANRIIRQVQDRFGVTLEPEPRIIRCV